MFLTLVDPKWSDRLSDYQVKEDFLMVFEDWSLLKILFF